MPDRDRTRKTFEVDTGIAVLSLLRLVAVDPGGESLVEGDIVSERLEATYYDTADHRLARNGLSLRRRTGEGRAGWQVGIPGADSGLPVDVPGRATLTVPAAINRLVWASTRGEALRPVVRIETERTVYGLVDAAGETVLQLADESVRGERLGDSSAAFSLSAWRVLEVQSHGREWQDAVAAQLRDIGARDFDGRSDLVRVWDDTGGDPRLPHTGGRKSARRGSPDSPAGEVVLHYVSQQVEQIFASDPLVRIDSPGSVHRMRVATRRLRSCLQSFQTILRTDVVAPLRSELRWLAGQLGAARDAEVMRDRMRTAVREEASRVHLGPLGDAVDTEMSQAYRTAHDGLRRVLDSERYHRIVIALHDLLTDPPVTAKAARPASQVLPARAAGAYAKVKSLVKKAHRTATPADRDTQLHEARKAAKKARYVGETLAHSFGKPAARFAHAMENLQEKLGEHQDSVVMRARVEELARRETSPTAAFAYGRLHAHEERRGELAVELFQAAWQNTTKKKLRAWLT